MESLAHGDGCDPPESEFSDWRVVERNLTAKQIISSPLFRTVGQGVRGISYLMSIDLYAVEEEAMTTRGLDA